MGALEGVKVPQNVELGMPAFGALSGRLQGTYKLWAACVDLHDLLSRATWYRHRRELLKFGVDIAQPPAGRVFEAPRMPDIVPLLRQLEGHLKGVPECAMGTPLYCEPRALLAS